MEQCNLIKSHALCTQTLSKRMNLERFSWGIKTKIGCSNSGLVNFNRPCFSVHFQRVNNLTIFQLFKVWRLKSALNFRNNQLLKVVFNCHRIYFIVKFNNKNLDESHIPTSTSNCIANQNGTSFDFWMQFHIKTSNISSLYFVHQSKWQLQVIWFQKPSWVGRLLSECKTTMQCHSNFSYPFARKMQSTACGRLFKVHKGDMALSDLNALQEKLQIYYKVMAIKT